MRIVIVFLLVLLGAPSSAVGQAARWVVRSLPQADLWYAGLAQLPFEGFSGLPMYSTEYAQTLRDAKRMARIQTRLDTERAALHAAIARDSAFEVLHFVPIYFVGTDRAGMFAALRAVAAGEDPASLSDPHARFGATFLAAVLPTNEQRAVLGRLTAAMEDEWQRFFGRWWTQSAAERSRQADSVQTVWDAVLAEWVEPLLTRVRLDTGLIVLSPALGSEGRIYAGRPEDRADNVVAVRLPTGAAGAAVAAVSIVREFCHPWASTLIAERGGADS
ncbi:MAG: hypothetical protein OEY20_15060, partial [Gemmatimonadota bacterium]|nr:hypothetical protein [Gemmatimonadota bacterium]